MRTKYNSLKCRALGVLENRGWLAPAAWAALATFTPTGAAYSYLKRLHRWHLLDRAHNDRGRLVYRLNAKGSERLSWLRQTMEQKTGGRA